MQSGDIQSELLDGLTPEQASAVRSDARQLLVVAGAGSGKTEVMARRIAWWVGANGVDRDKIVAFTFTEKAAEEMKFRIRKWVGKITPDGEDATLGRMYVGTIHGFCLKMLQELAPAKYGVYDILDDVGRIALIQKGFHGNLGLNRLKNASGSGQFATIKDFQRGYDLLHEFDLFEAAAPGSRPPEIGPAESEWIKEWRLVTDVGNDGESEAFAASAAAYHGTLHARRLLDFSTVQSEISRLLRTNSTSLEQLREMYSYVVVDELQDINPVQNRIIGLLLGSSGTLTAVGDHRQAIYGFRGGRVQLMGDWFDALRHANDGEVVTLPDNFRSTPRIINLANSWSQTIEPPGGMDSPAMAHGNNTRVDQDDSHVSVRHFDDRDAEAEWIAERINDLVDSAQSHGAPHDVRNESDRGLGRSDIAILTRSAADSRLYFDALERNGIPAIVRAGPDLFERPEVQLLLSALCIAADVNEFFSGGWAKSMGSIAQNVLNCPPKANAMLRSAAALLETAGLDISPGDAARLEAAAQQIHNRLSDRPTDHGVIGRLRTAEMCTWLKRTGAPRRIYPQTLFQWLAAEAGIAKWDIDGDPRATAAMFHLGQLAGLMTGVETPGWVTPSDFKWQMIALTNWGAKNARSEEAPLLVDADAVSILTIHAAKGLEFPVVFLADVAASRFPSSMAKRVEDLPFGGAAATEIDAASLSDNDNNDSERRLMYVGITRAERYLHLTSGSAKRSRFEREVATMVDRLGGQANPTTNPVTPALIPTSADPTFRLVTSFSDLRYYIECPHDYYLRKVLGFAPTIDQAFGYGRGVHNMMSELHLRPKEFAALAGDPVALASLTQQMIDDGLFYLRYTTGEPLENMKRRARQVVAEYVAHYANELDNLEFEPERSFETLIEEADVLVGGAIDLVRHDNPPHVSVIDFKSGDPNSPTSNGALDKQQMQLQLTLYALAAKKELSYDTDLGLVRYLGVPDGATTAERELEVPLDSTSIDAAKETVIEVTKKIQGRNWHEGPRQGQPGEPSRCTNCDFLNLCGRTEADAARKSK